MNILYILYEFSIFVKSVSIKSLRISQLSMTLVVYQADFCHFLLNFLPVEVVPLVQWKGVSFVGIIPSNRIKEIVFVSSIKKKRIPANQ
jgi:hypothetical protein